MKFIDKELIRVFDWSDYKSERDLSAEECVMGRTYIKLGQYTATTLVGNLYKINDPSNKQFNYVLHIGLARQHPNDRHVNYAEGVENAMSAAFINPVITMNLQNAICYDEFATIAEMYAMTLNAEFVRTADEIKHNNISKLIYE